MRFSLRWLFAVVAIAAIFAAALSHPTPTWDAITFNVTIALLVVATLIALSTNPKRPFWIAASFVGWAHLILDSFPFTVHSPSSKIFTRRLSYEIWALWHRDTYLALLDFVTSRDAHDALFFPLQLQGTSLHSDDIINMLDIMQCFFTLVVAAVAGVITSMLLRRKVTTLIAATRL
jgi:hypothetical protein